MLLVDDSRFISAPFSNEEELESVVLENYEYIFGPDSILLPKRLIKSPDGAGTIPDAFAVDLLQRRWYLVEAELASHGVWTHIAPQVAKQLVASTQAATRGLLGECVVDLYKSDDTVRAKFDEHGVAEIDVRAVVAEIFASEPIVAIPIDDISRDLRLWAKQLKVEVRLWTVRKLVDFEDASRIAYEIPDEFRPTVDSAPTAAQSAGYAVYDVSLPDLIQSGHLVAGQSLTMKYKPRGGEQHTYSATLEADGTLTVLGERFSSPSYAAVRGINDAGSPRKTVNGWTSWYVDDGRTLADLRSDFLASESKEGGSTV